MGAPDSHATGNFKDQNKFWLVWIWPCFWGVNQGQ